MNRTERWVRDAVTGVVVIIGATYGIMSTWEFVGMLREANPVTRLFCTGCLLYAAWRAGRLSSRLSFKPVSVTDVTQGQPPLDEQFQALADMDPNWDSYGGVPPTDAALAAAHDYVKMIARPPDVIPINDGGIELDYPTVIVVIGPDGNILSINAAPQP